MKNNKLKKVILSAITATMISCSLPFTALAAVQVNPIENLSTDFIKGADVSIMPELERNGTKFYDNGIEQDGLTILYECNLFKSMGLDYVYVKDQKVSAVVIQMKLRLLKWQNELKL